MHKPKVFDLDDLLKAFPLEERVYRMRCVEGWSMVIPWVGFPLATLLERVEPMGGARSTSRSRRCSTPRACPNQRAGVLDWPYVEGLRMDEAMHPLTILATGLYGHEHAAAERRAGAAGRAVEVRLQGDQVDREDHAQSSTSRASTWNRAGPSEYGFYSNVNPEVDHPRWSQATEQRIGESGRRPTLMFNGYGEQVAPPVRGDGPAGQLLRRAARMKVTRFARSVVLLNLRCAGDPPRLGRLEGPARRQPGQLRHPDDRDPLR